MDRFADILWIEHEKIGTKDYLRIVQNNYGNTDALKRQLHFLPSCGTNTLRSSARFRRTFR